MMTSSFQSSSFPLIPKTIPIHVSFASSEASCSSELISLSLTEISLAPSISLRTVSQISSALSWPLYETAASSDLWIVWLNTNTLQSHSPNYYTCKSQSNATLVSYYSYREQLQEVKNMVKRHSLGLMMNLDSKIKTWILEQFGSAWPACWTRSMFLLRGKNKYNFFLLFFLGVPNRNLGRISNIIIYII